MADLNQNFRLITNCVDYILKSSTTLHSDKVHIHIDVLNNDKGSTSFDHTDEVSKDASLSNIFVSKNIKKTISQMFLDVITAFRQYSSSISEVSRSDKVAKMGMTDLIHILNSVGEENLFQMSKLNKHFMFELKSQKSPSTFVFKLLSLSRFVEYLNIQASHLLPSGKILINLYLASRHNSLIKQFLKRRQQSIMTKSRVKYTCTSKVLKEWRQLREKHNLIIFSEGMRIPPKFC
ncbi:hypothetical protein LOD99_6166 [Oopsacas minuta]|uniref:Uncharacterized protein n=1 Tax=Oopsacas minuta TaxID=111878 RepID=A0AAV7JMQ5_9METZ|nr:hypothetical protein LOD99_6166 [Oopsacas minuta]